MKVETWFRNDHLKENETISYSETTNPLIYWNRVEQSSVDYCDKSNLFLMKSKSNQLAGGCSSLMSLLNQVSMATRSVKCSIKIFSWLNRTISWFLGSSSAGSINFITFISRCKNFSKDGKLSKPWKAMKSKYLRKVMKSDKY